MQLTELQEKWLTELESGKHTQCAGRLFDGIGHCCLGIACEFVFDIKPTALITGLRSLYQFNGAGVGLNTLESNQLQLRSVTGKIAGEYVFSFAKLLEHVERFNKNVQNSLASYNDCKIPFKDLAAAIRKMPYAVFTNGTPT